MFATLAAWAGLAFVTGSFLRLHYAAPLVTTSPGPATPANIDPVHYLIQHGYTQLTTYQPASRFWPFQWIEGGWLLALSLLLLAATVWLVRRRVA